MKGEVIGSLTRFGGTFANPSRRWNKIISPSSTRKIPLKHVSNQSLYRQADRRLKLIHGHILHFDFEPVPKARIRSWSKWYPIRSSEIDSSDDLLFYRQKSKFERRRWWSRRLKSLLVTSNDGEPPVPQKQWRKESEDIKHRKISPITRDLQLSELWFYSTSRIVPAMHPRNVLVTIISLSASVRRRVMYMSRFQRTVYRRFFFLSDYVCNAYLFGVLIDRLSSDYVSMQ